MTLALSLINEGSEEARQKRSIRRYLNKKKQRPVEEAVVIENDTSWEKHIDTTLGNRPAWKSAVQKHHGKDVTFHHAHDQMHNSGNMHAVKGGKVVARWDARIGGNVHEAVSDESIVIDEGSEEARMKRAKRILQKAKGKRPVDEAAIDEGSEEARLKRAKRFIQKTKGKRPVDESIDEALVAHGTVDHMRNAVHIFHTTGQQSGLGYHVMRTGVDQFHAVNGDKMAPIHHYVILNHHNQMPHKHPALSAEHAPHGFRHPMHKFTVADRVVGVQAHDVVHKGPINHG